MKKMIKKSSLREIDDSVIADPRFQEVYIGALAMHVLGQGTYKVDAAKHKEIYDIITDASRGQECDKSIMLELYSKEPYTMVRVLKLTISKHSTYFKISTAEHFVGGGDLNTAVNQYNASGQAPNPLGAASCEELDPERLKEPKNNNKRNSPQRLFYTENILERMARSLKSSATIAHVNVF